MQMWKPVLLFLFCWLLACDQGPAQPVPVIKAFRSAQKTTIVLEIPAGHHAYLDSGKEGNLIAVAFQWDGPAPALKLSPLGLYDDKVQAKVLHGRGEWQFEVTEAKSVKVRSQLCDEKIGLCYPPQETSVKVQHLK